MALYAFEGRRPRLGGGTYVPETADVVGDVVLGEDPAGKIAVGSPAKVLAAVTEEHKATWRPYKRAYADLARDRYPAGLERID